MLILGFIAQPILSYAQRRHVGRQSAQRFDVPAAEGCATMHLLGGIIASRNSDNNFNAGFSCSWALVPLHV